MSKKTRDILSLTDLNREEFIDLIDHAIRLKEQTKAGICPQLLSGRMAGLIFHKPSLRTRISFEVGTQQLGCGAMFITDKEIQLGGRETIADAARVLSRYLDVLIVRTFHQSDIEELAQWSDAPVINALTDAFHPCQVFCDMLTIREKLGVLEGIKVAYFGDGNNMTRSWMNAARLLDIDLWVATTPETHPGQEFLEECLDGAKGKITITDDPANAAKDADVIYTDVWASMGEKEKAAERSLLLQAFQLNSSLLEKAKSSCIVMHCLPAERGLEITDELMDGHQSVVFDQAENRLHGQKSLLLWALGEI